MEVGKCHLDGDIINECLKIQDVLIDTEKYVKLLVDNIIIVSWMGDANAVVIMINSLGSHLAMPHFN